eukprot:RCo005272
MDSNGDDVQKELHRLGSEEYLRVFRIDRLLFQLVGKLLAHRPADPLRFLRQALGSEGSPGHRASFVLPPESDEKRRSMDGTGLWLPNPPLGGPPCCTSTSPRSARHAPTWATPQPTDRWSGGVPSFTRQ